MIARARAGIANAWLAMLFGLTLRAPRFVRAVAPVALWFAWWAPGVRAATTANAARLLGTASTRRDRARLGRRVLASFYEAVAELGANRGRTREQLLATLESVEGEPGYDAARARKRGAVLVTAHLGPYETAIAMLTAREPRVHVVFRRDRSPAFERLRSEQHARLGVVEAPVDDGPGVWFRLRDALRRDEVVLIQGDRTAPGEKGEPVAFMGGRLRLPAAPVKLARAAGAPIVPAFAARVAGGRVRIMLGEPIWPDELRPAPGGPDPALLRVAAAIERCVARYPEQWLVLHHAWCDEAPEVSGT